jgi:outer membrane protein OmpA-like peptidoglycan-associated protein
MKTRLISCAGLVFSLLSSNVMAEPTVRYLKEEDITKDNLIKILSGQSTEEEIKVRGIKPTDSAGPQATTAGSQPPIGSAQPAAAQCAAQQRRIRGIQVVSVSDSAAMAVQFAFNSANLSPQAERNLSVLAAALNSNQLRSSSFEIEGHTDNIGSERYNQQLSEARAKSVVVYLVRQHGIEAARLTPIGCGQQYPIDSNSTESGRQMNRRVQIQGLSK